MVIDLLAQPDGAAVRQLEPYHRVPEGDLRERIGAARERLGDSLLVLGHHYQKDEVIEFADLRGDSLKLSQLAAESRACRHVIFCGVHFMAETADMLTADDVEVILPDMAAGCSMADMADIDQVEACWEELGEVVDTSEITPVTYINSTAALKAFCGRHGGVVCTSGNAERVLRWAFGQRKRVLFFPDQHLGRNTAKAMGVPLSRMKVWDPALPLGGNNEGELAETTVYLWKGWCSVHQMFKPEHIDLFRGRDPEMKILVHPECPMEVVDRADIIGSTERIINTVAAAPAGSKWAIGTELHLVNRLKQEHPEQTIHFLSPMVCMCATMYRIDLPHLCWAMENLVDGVVVNRIKVDGETTEKGLLALQRMLDLS
ncbi:Quinolinate synthase A [Planctomycetes bacterium Pan216]|uniref:Quinolinate synthase n=1 Tax=Kolteria novifilia TaxID=2527975 RepID=A0A518B8D1_9BACT|nr:Quinolinate synthase A [Planctomycetes bacterium Pan216]